MALTSTTLPRLTEVDATQHDLNEALSNAGRTGRGIADVLASKRSLRASLLATAVSGGLAAAGLGVANVLWLAEGAMLAVAAAVAGSVSAGAAAFLLAADRTAPLDQMIADLSRCDGLLRQLKALRRIDVGVSPGKDVVDAALLELKEIAARYATLEEVEMAPVRRDERIEARNRPIILTLPDGTREIVTVKDISRSGVAVNTDVRIKIGAVLTLGSTPVRAVRSIPGGTAFEFLRPFPREKFSPDIIF